MNPLTGNAVSHLQKILSEPDLSNTKYAILRKIGSGGMAEVYLVFDAELERETALKVIHPACTSEDFSRRMMQEAKVIARMEHPGIVPVHDVGVLPDGRIFYVMKFVQGEPLDAFARKLTGMRDRLQILEKICDAVAFAHSRGVLHRDLKPQNVMIGAYGEVQVMDWGLAKVLSQQTDETRQPQVSSASDFKTDAGTLMGTPGYMAPEQTRGEISLLNEKTDIYGLGAILYYLLTLSAPQSGAAPRQLNRDIPRRVEAICLKAMRELPADRYDTVAEVSADIHNYLNGFSMIAYRENILEKIARWSSRHSFVLLLILAYLLMRVLLFLFAGR